MDNILFVIPVYNEENYILAIVDDIRNSITNQLFYYDILFVNDGSEDKTENIIKKLASQDEKIKYVSFSRNFGKEAAIFCGLEKSKQNNYTYTCIIDCDGQDPVDLISTMYNNIVSISQKVDAVACRRIDRKGEALFRSFLSNCFYSIFNLFSENPIPKGARDYILMNEKFRDSLLLHRERCRFFKGLYTSIGFNLNWIEYENVHISGRNSKWSITDLFSYAVEGIVSSSESLLKFSSGCGGVFFFVSFIVLIFVFIRAFLFGDPVAGWPSLVCIILFVAGLQFIFLGIMGEYIAKSYKEIKNRPIYIEKDGNI